jgi:membrane-associated phospholipid phosphatase
LLRDTLVRYQTIKFTIDITCTDFNFMKQYLSILFLILLRLNLLSVNDSVSYVYTRFNGKYIKSCATEGYSLAKSPFTWKPKQWLTAGLIIGTGVIVYTQDEHIRDFWQSNQGSIGTKLSKYVFEPWGSGKYTAPAVGTIYFAGMLVKDDRMASTALAAGKAALLSGILIEITKRLTQRQRAYEGQAPNHAIWNGPFAGTNYTSFPSGHAGFAFSVATVFASEYKQTVWVPILCYSIATGTGLSRLYDDAHWASDVFIGAVTGYVIGRFIWKQSRKPIAKLSLIPSVNPGSLGMYMKINLGK